MKTIKLSANLSRPVFDALCEISDRLRVTRTEVLRLAISHEKYWMDCKAQGKRILIARRDGFMREVIF